MSTATLASNKTNNDTEEHHDTTEELLEHFFEKYGDKSGNISPLQLCNLTMKLGKCAGNTESDQHGHDDEKEEKHSEADEQSTHHEEDNDEEKGHHDYGEVRKMFRQIFISLVDHLHSRVLFITYFDYSSLFYDNLQS